MRKPLFIIGCWLLLYVGIARAEVFYWTDADGSAHFSDTAPVDKQAKTLRLWNDCPLRAEIVDLDISDRANLGLWLYLGASRTTEQPGARRSRNYDRWPKSGWEFDREVRHSRTTRLKNEIISEARRCGAGNEKACTCSRSLFHDPPRGFAPEGYVPPSWEQIRVLGGQLAQRDLTQP